MFMNIRKYLFGLLLLGGFPLWAGSAPERPSAVMEAKDHGPEAPPLWVSAEAARDEKTVLNWDVLRGAHLKSAFEAQRENLRKRGVLVEDGESGSLEVRSLAGEPCDTRIGVADMIGGPQPRNKLSDLLSYSRAIVRGTVRAVEPGFLSGFLPSSLLRVEVEEVLRDGHEYADSSSLYVYHSAAHFSIGPYHFCGDPPSFEPKVGDRILVFDYDGPKDRDSSLIVPTDSEVFFETPAGDLFLPNPMSEDPDLKSVKSLAELAERVRRAPYSGQPAKVDPRLRN